MTGCVESLHSILGNEGYATICCSSSSRPISDRWTADSRVQLPPTHPVSYEPRSIPSESSISSQFDVAGRYAHDFKTHTC